MEQASAAEAGKVIRVELLGGLGNQLFQAAAGFALARRLGAGLEFDLSRFRAHGARAYALDGLGHGARLVHGPVTPLGRGFHRLKRVVSAGRLRAPAGWRGAVFRERHYAYDPAFAALAGSTFLTGYWHSEKYFAPYAEAVRSAFDFEPVVSAAAQDFLRSMAPNALAVHVRLGDFKLQAKVSDVHGTLPPDYFAGAIKLVQAARPVDRIYVFTDTPEAMAGFLPPDIAYDLVRDLPARDDLYLMSRARHHIIANSTFSWWSAWLDARPGAMVVAPRAWLAPEALRKTDIRDLYPSGWTLL